MANTLFGDCDPNDSHFSLLLEVFLQAERVTGFAQASDGQQFDNIIKDMAAGRLNPAEVQELLGNLRSDPSAVARLAALLQKNKEPSKEESNA